MALRLQVFVTNRKTALVNAPLPPKKGDVDVRRIVSDELTTPAGLPLNFRAVFRGNFGEIEVRSAGALLLRLSTHVNNHAELRLPTDEMLEVAVLNY